MQITVIATGSSKWERFIRSWGVSFLLGDDILFDTFGDPGAFLENTRRLGIDTRKIKHIVISHDDWDHIGGLWYILNDRKDLTVYICPGFKAKTKERIRSYGVSVIETSGSTRIKDGVYSTGELCGESRGRKIYEQSLAIQTARGTAVVCGCAHPGIINILDTAQRQLGGAAYLAMGGFHLKDLRQKEIADIISGLQSRGLKIIAPMHCTGGPATRMLKESFAGGFIPVKQGSLIEV
ncbi:MAG: MBL fold metallo-hydrolase [Candidatus Omnitrophica bacterium]|nr:MBL fold metallo-hydrolase [Candidatus Omnitrophota bacterium]